MKKRLNRYPIKLTKIYFRKGKNIIGKNFTLFLKKYNVHGVQFHPESIKTPEGMKLLKNFINYKC